jgi:hypothetical protein
MSQKSALKRLSYYYKIYVDAGSTKAKLLLVL